MIFSNLIIAQKINYGLKVGLNLTGLHTQNGVVSDLVGYNFGGIVSYKTSATFTFQGELLLNKKGGIIRQSLLTTNPEINLLYINTPLLTKINIFKNFNFNFGPEIGFLIEKKTTIDGEEIDSGDISNIDFNITGGFEYNFKNGVFLQSRYSYGLSRLYESENYKNSAISLSLGYVLN